ncbi:1-phosphatidylinositol phosphodiesterase [BD1-7 clade bacterium]|nr:1-phosphatidylinositol phosphodiesterase [BD1-7 clade bacterium]
MIVRISAAIAALVAATTLHAASPAGGDVPHISLDKSRWMTQGYFSQPNKQLRNICIPGSHDTGTYSITSGIDENISQTQNLDVGEQLAAGYRYFDLRFKRSGSEWVAFHGPSTGAPLSAIGSDLQAFVNANPQEIVLLKVLVDGDKATREAFYADLSNYIGNRMAPRSLGTDVTFEDLWALDKNVIVLWTANDYASYPNTWSFSGSLIDPWANRTNINGLLGHQKDKANDPRNGKFFVHQMIRTPFGRGGNAGDDITDFFETVGTLSSIEKLSQGLNAAAMVYLLDGIAKQSGQRVNIAMVDFMEYQKVWEACMDVNDLEEDNWFYLKNKRDNTCLRANGDDVSDGVRTHLGGCDSYSGAKWRYNHATSEMISGKWDANGNYCLDTVNEAHNNGAPALWWCHKQGGNQTFIWNTDTLETSNSNVVLDSYGNGKVGFWDKNGGNNQAWSRVYQ